MDAAKKNFRRFQQRANQNLGLSEKTDVVSADVHRIEERVDTFVDVLVRCKQKLAESLRSKPKEENIEKRRKKLAECTVGQSFLTDARSLEDIFADGLLSQILTQFGASLLNVSDELAQSELNIERRIFEPLAKFVEDHKIVAQQKEKLKNAVLDMDSARSRLNNAQGEKVEQLQLELDTAWNKVENLKDNWTQEIYGLAGREIDAANVILLAAKIQLDFYKSAYNTLQATLPLMQAHFDQYARRPVFGCPLADHLRYSKREIAVVLEVCCSALIELGCKEEGLFRLSGSVSKIKKLKAMFDVDELDFSDWENQSQCIAGVLKLYLRELPEPLMTHQLYSDWLKAAEEPDIEMRLKNLKQVVECLPDANFKNLRYLIRFLTKVVENQQYTKMNCQNLAIVIAPNLLRSPSISVDDGFKDNAAITNLIECLISNVDYFFPGDVKFISPKIISLVNRTGGFMDEAGSFGGRMDESTRSISPPADECSSSGNNSLTRSPATVQSSSLSRRPKQPAPPPPDQSLADQKRPASLKNVFDSKNVSAADALIGKTQFTTSVVCSNEQPLPAATVNNQLQTSASAPQRSHRKCNSLKGNEQVQDSQQHHIAQNDDCDSEKSRSSSGAPSTSTTSNRGSTLSDTFPNSSVREKALPCSLPGRPPLPEKEKPISSSRPSAGISSTACTSITRPSTKIITSVRPNDLVTSVQIGDFSDDHNEKPVHEQKNQNSVHSDTVVPRNVNKPLPSVAPRLSMKKILAQLDDDFDFYDRNNNGHNNAHTSENNSSSSNCAPPPRPKPPVPVKPCNSNAGANASVAHSSDDFRSSQQPASDSTRL